MIHQCGYCCERCMYMYILLSVGQRLTESGNISYPLEMYSKFDLPNWNLLSQMIKWFGK